MIATGTDVKPIEVLIFMRDVRSRNYFQQMIGRGTRSLNKDELIKVTPSAKLNKERFYIIDAVGAFKSVKVDYPVVDKKPSVQLKDLMKMVILQPDEANCSYLASRLIRMDKQISDTDREKFKQLSGGKDITEIANDLANIYDPDYQLEIVGQISNLSPDEEPAEEQIQSAIQPIIQSTIRLFDNPKLREFVETVRQKIYQIIDETNPDRIISSGFDTTAKENSEDIINNFRKFINENKDEIIALRIFYSLKTFSHSERSEESPTLDKHSLTYAMIKELRDALMSPPYQLTVEQIWRAYERTEPKRVKHKTTVGMLTDIISLIRFELKLDETLEPYTEIVNRRFKEWVFKRNAGPVQFTEEQMEWLRMIKDHIVSSVRIEVEDFAQSSLVIDAVVRNIEIIGETSRNIPEEIQKKFLEIPWQKIKGIRNRIVHEYFSVDITIIWFIIKNELDSLKNALQKHLNENK